VGGLEGPSHVAVVEPHCQPGAGALGHSTAVSCPARRIATFTGTARVPSLNSAEATVSRSSTRRPIARHTEQGSRSSRSASLGAQATFAARRSAGGGTIVTVCSDQLRDRSARGLSPTSRCNSITSSHDSK
jgi:hypothetical protein